MTIFTTLPNAVHDMLAVTDAIDLTVVDVSSCRPALDPSAEKPDMILTYRCPYILSQELYLSALTGAFNIHPTLLPSCPGLNPWPSLFHDIEVHRLHSAEPFVSGVTLHRLSQIPDAGEIIIQNKFSITESDTIPTARAKADIAAAEMLKRWLDDIF